MRHVWQSSPEIEDPGKYPSDKWEAQRAKYHEYWYHFDGDWLDEEVSSGTPKFPLKLNIFNMACLLHAGFLFGEVEDSSDPLVTPIVEMWGQDSSDKDRAMAKEMTELLARVWCENQGRSLQQEGGIISQVLGGCVLGTAYDPDMGDRGMVPIRIDLLMPEYFFPVWHPTRYWNLLETFVAFQVTALQAKLLYGVESEQDPALYQEHWSPGDYEITVGGMPAFWKNTLLSGKPLGGFVPYTYIPHIRIGEFYGISLLDDKLDLAREVNARMADLGDMLQESASQLPAIANCQMPQVRRLSHGVMLLDLSHAIPGRDAPRIYYPTGVQASSASVSYATDLLSLARTQVYTPPVCYGVDEGSQRSALTLALRMMPLLVHIRQERSHWSDGLGQVARQILMIAAEKGVGSFTVEDVYKARIWQDWSPILPRDREQMVNEITWRVNAKLMSPATAMERLGGIRDLKTETNLIKEWMEYQAQQKPAGKQPGILKGAGSPDVQASGIRPTQDTPPTGGSSNG